MRGFDVFVKAVAGLFLGQNKDISAETYIKNESVRQMILNPALISLIQNEIIDQQQIDGIIVDTTSVGVIFKKTGLIETAYLQQLGVDVERHKGEDGWQEAARLLGNKERAEQYRAMLNAFARTFYELKALKTGSSTYTLESDHPIPVAKAIDQVAHDVRDHSRLMAGARALIHDAILGRAVNIQNVEAGKTTVLVNTQDHFRDIIQNGGTVLITGGGLRGVQEDLKRQFGATLFLGVKLDEHKLAGARDAEYEQIIPETSQTVEEASSIREILTAAYRRGNNILVTMPKELDWSPKMAVAFRNILPQGRMIMTDSNGKTYEIPQGLKTLADVEKLISEKLLKELNATELQSIHIEHPGLIHVVNGAGIGLDLKFDESRPLMFMAIADTTSPMERVRQAYRPRFAVNDSKLVILNMTSVENIQDEALRVQAVRQAWANQVQLDREVTTERALTLIMEVNQRRLNLILEAEIRNNNLNAIREIIRVREIWRDGNEIFTMAHRGMERTAYTLQRAVEHSQTAFEQDLGSGSRAYNLLTPAVRERFVDAVIQEVNRQPSLLRINLDDNNRTKLSYFEPTTVVQAVVAINGFNTHQALTTHTAGVAGQAYSVVMGRPESRMSIHISQQPGPQSVTEFARSVTRDKEEAAKVKEAIMVREGLSMSNPTDASKESVLSNNNALAFIVNSLATATPEQIREFNRAVPSLSAFGISSLNT